MKPYELTDEHRAQLDPWLKKSIAIAMSTKAMDDDDKAKMVVAVNGLYEAAGLSRPKHIVFVPSPFVMTFAGGFAAGIWHLHKSAATRAATLAATLAATRDATLAATRDATLAATLAATRSATLDATLSATLSATRDATRDATSAATRAATSDAKWFKTPSPSEWHSVASLFGAADFLLSCANRIAEYWSMWDGGNQWYGWISWISFFSHVVKLPLNYIKWKHYEDAGTYGGPRIMHPDFCIISDRPEILTVDDQNRPHNDAGPFCRWRDGTALYSIHGVRLPWWIVEHPDLITVDLIGSENNVEIRRIMIERYGLSKYLLDSGAVAIGTDDYGTLYRRDIPGDEALVMVKVVNSTPEPDGSFKDYFLRVDPRMKTAREAVAWTFGKATNDYHPLVET